MRGELEELGAGIGRIRAPVTILQGLHDTLVPPENSAYLAAGLASCVRGPIVLVEQAGHFLHIRFAGLVEEILRQMLAEAGRAT